MIITASVIGVEPTAIWYTRAMNKYWFRKRAGLKSKDLGWGWVPVSWEGWLVVVLMVASVFAVSLQFAQASANEGIEESTLAVNGALSLLALLLVIALSVAVSHKKSRP